MEILAMALAAAWIALAVACSRKGQGVWVAWAVLWPILVFVVSFLAAGAIVRSQATGGLEDLGLAIIAMLIVVVLTVGLSFALLIVGVTRPAKLTVPAEERPDAPAA